MPGEDGAAVGIDLAEGDLHGASGAVHADDRHGTALDRLIPDEGGGAVHEAPAPDLELRVDHRVASFEGHGSGAPQQRGAHPKELALALRAPAAGAQLVGPELPRTAVAELHQPIIERRQHQAEHAINAPAARGSGALVMTWRHACPLSARCQYSSLHWSHFVRHQSM